MLGDIYLVSLIYLSFFAYLAKVVKGNNLHLRSQGLSGVPPLNITVTKISLRNNSIVELGPYEFSWAPGLHKLSLLENLLTHVDDLAFCNTSISTLLYGT